MSHARSRKSDGIVDVSAAGKLNVIIAEFDKLKEEQVSRIQYRENLYYLTMLVAGGLIAASYGDVRIERSTIVLPIVLFIILTVYNNNDDKITAIGEYIENCLAKNTGQLLGEDMKYFGWEGYHREKSGRALRKFRHFISKIILFVGAPISAAALFVSSSNGVISGLDKSILIIGIICTFWNAIVVFLNADINVQKHDTAI